MTYGGCDVASSGGMVRGEEDEGGDRSGGGRVERPHQQSEGALAATMVLSTKRLLAPLIRNRSAKRSRVPRDRHQTYKGSRFAACGPQHLSPLPPPSTAPVRRRSILKASTAPLSKLDFKSQDSTEQSTRLHTRLTLFRRTVRSFF